VIEAEHRGDYIDYDYRAMEFRKFTLATDFKRLRPK